MAESEYYKKMVTEAVLKNQPVTFATPHVGLAISGWSVDSTTSEVSGEMVGTGYSRVPVQWTDFTTDMSNLNEILWSVGSSWPGVEMVFISDSFQGGRALLYDSSISGPSVTTGDILAINVGGLVVT